MIANIEVIIFRQIWGKLGIGSLEVIGGNIMVAHYLSHYPSIGGNGDTSYE
jgi:hypothetical protein